MTRRPALPIAFARESRFEKPKRLALRCWRWLPSIAIGSSITVGILALGALLLASMGGSDGESSCDLHGEGERDRSASRRVTVCRNHGFRSCFFGPQALQIRFDMQHRDDLDLLDYDIDPAYPSVPDIGSSWSTRAGSMSSSTSSNYSCTYVEQDALEAYNPARALFSTPPS